MKNKFFMYTSNMRKLPKSFLAFIIILLLILIPLIIFTALVVLTVGLLYFLIRIFLPTSKKEQRFKRQETVISIDENGNILR